MADYNSSTNGGFLRHISQMQQVEWDKGYLWDIRFNDGNLNAPFNAWFPASDFTENSNTGSSLTVPYYITQCKFPQGTGPTDISMTVHDTHTSDLYKWLTNWYDEVYDTTFGVMMLNDAVRELQVVKLNVQREIVKNTIYYVYPEGSVICAYHSQAGAKTYDLTFSVAGSKSA